MIAEIEKLPEVSFIEGRTLDDVQAEMIADYQEKYEELTGDPLTLRPADPEMVMIYACSVQLYQMALHIDMAGKMDLLKYAYGGFLDNLGAMRGVTRLPASPAKCTVKFTLSAAQDSQVTIPQGTKVSDGDALYFMTNETVEIAAKSTEADIPCTCQTAGEIGNGLAEGAVNVLVDLLPYVASVSNTDVTAGGTEEESDEDFTDRIYLAQSAYSVAGSIDAYIYHTKEYSADIGDVEVTSPEPGQVDIKILMEDGKLPDDDFMHKVEAHLSADTIRPLTDKVKVSKPDTTDLTVNLKYFVSESNKDMATTIQSAVAAAIQDYIAWQTSAIGRDINPSVLIQRIMEAGAKRVEVTSPVYTKVEPGHVAHFTTQTVTYGGVEDD